MDVWKYEILSRSWPGYLMSEESDWTIECDILRDNFMFTNIYVLFIIYKRIILLPHKNKAIMCFMIINTIYVILWIIYTCEIIDFILSTTVFYIIEWLIKIDLDSFYWVPTKWQSYRLIFSCQSWHIPISKVITFSDFCIFCAHVAS